MNGVTANKSKENPWKVPNLDVYHIWACPECGYKCQTKSLLVHHAVLQHPQAREVFQQKPGDKNIKITMAKPNFQPIKDESKLEVRFLDLDYTARKDVVQCYHCGTMLPRNEMFMHMEANHGKFYSHMCGPPRPYQCSVCRRTMETEKQYQSHRCQEAKGPFKCHSCNVNCEWRSDLVEHLSQRHNIRAKIDLKAKIQIQKETKMSTAAAAPTTTTSSTTTPRKVVPTISFKCQYCQDKFPNKPRLMEHIRQHEVDGTLKCLYCDQYFNNAPALNLHHHIQHEAAVKNESQQQQQPTSASASSVAGNSNLKICQFCSKTYRDPKAFARHVATAHPVTNDVKALQSVICDECNHEFQNAYMLNKHQATCCSETRCFPCKKCDTFWNSALSLRHHYAEDHTDIIEVCGVCGATLANSKTLESHLNQFHYGTPSYSCDFCDKTFYAQGSLDNHTFKVHKIQVSFNCELCDFACTRKNELESHIQAIHYSNTRYFCDICQFATFSKAKLTAHKRKSHRYECSQCDQTFETSREKNQHEKDHFPKKTAKRRRY